MDSKAASASDVSWLGAIPRSRGSSYAAVTTLTCCYEGTIVSSCQQRLNSHPATKANVFILDDDGPVRDALSSLFRSVGLQVEQFTSAQEFLQTTLPAVPTCLVLDIRLPGLSGLDLQAEMARAQVEIPIIFITGHGDVPMSVQAMKAGAVDFLTKPFRDQDMLDAVSAALERDRVRREHQQTLASLRARLEVLTARERQVLQMVVNGLINRKIAEEIGIAEITVKIHRSNVMRKMNAGSLADLVRMAGILNISHSEPDT
jgi:FixJ family two-component response regulator